MNNFVLTTCCKQYKIMSYAKSKINRGIEYPDQN
jgi:hypothetical protein